jgi:hypothetical protein
MGVVDGARLLANEHRGFLTEADKFGGPIVVKY